MPSRADAAPSFLYSPELAPVGGRLVLSSEESHYVRRVCRARLGDPLTLVDGRGGIAHVRLVAVGSRTEAEVEKLDRIERLRTAWVCTGAPEGQRADWMIEKLAELGVSTWQPLECERARWTGAPGRLERWQRIAVAALRQSRRAFLMEIREPATVDAALDRLPARTEKWLARAEGARGVVPRGEPAAVFIGPARGFGSRESATLETAGARPICLSDGRLRTETAAVTWAGLTLVP